MNCPLVLSAPSPTEGLVDFEFNVSQSFVIVLLSRHLRFFMRLVAACRLQPFICYEEDIELGQMSVALCLSISSSALCYRLLLSMSPLFVALIYQTDQFADS